MIFITTFMISIFSLSYISTLDTCFANLHFRVLGEELLAVDILINNNNTEIKRETAFISDHFKKIKNDL